MRIFVFALAAIAAASAASINREYLTPVVDNSLTTQEYIAPEASTEPAPLTDDGYRYKVVRKLKLRSRRDVSELVNNEYLPPANNGVATATEETVVVEEPAVDASQDSAVLADDGYRYKTVRRIRFRRRRDVNELPTNEYLPPAVATEQEIVVEAPIEAPEESASQESAVLADDGYRYKTVRRIRYRRRRDVNELPTNEYLPPAAATEQEIVVEAPVEAPEESASQESAVLADDGYRYKTVRRIRYRRRRDVNELPSNEYLPPAAATEQEIVVEAPIEAPEESASQESAVLADDGYRYKTVRRIRYRHRRDVNELPSNEYLPPAAATEQEIVVESPVEAPEESASQESAVLADDGYRYKTVRRIRYRHRRDVNELPSNEYLPPAAATEQEIVVESPVEAPEESASQESAVLADDGYRYKTLRRIRYRHRRDVNELPSNEYLPPASASEQDITVESIPEQSAVIAEAPVEAASQDTAVLANDGYRYKTIRRIRYRRRRDVNELPSNEYLPPAVSQTEEIASIVSVPEQSTVLSDDGYRYKTVRRLKYRQRRDVNELAGSEYLPPVSENTFDSVVAVESPQEAAVLADDGYRYKTVRKLKHRRY